MSPRIGEVALPLDPPGEFQVADGMPEGSKIHQLVGVPWAFTPDYAPEDLLQSTRSSHPVCLKGD